MLPSLGGRGGGISNGQAYHRAPSSSSSPPSKSSSTSSSSPSPFSPYTRTMEEVWKDINFTPLQQHRPPALHHPTSSAPAATPTFRSIILQDFLNTATNTTRPNPSTASPAVDCPSFFGCPPPTPPPPATVLSLNSTPEFHFLDASHSDHHLHSLPVPNFNAPFDAFASNPFLSSFGSKRFPEEAENAYINELELEVATLVEENARLRRQQEQHQFFQAAPAAQLPKKRCGLQRTSTAPF
ncbi:hypothetical protein Ancab_003136 [Ancistrocladus abbreviatus]